MLIGEFSNKSKLNRETIRFYEREGLLKVKRQGNKYREYSYKDIIVVKVIQDLKELGFSLSEIKDILNLCNSEERCRHVQLKLEQNLKKINKKLSVLRDIQSKIIVSISKCSQNPDKKSCEIIEKVILE